MNTNDAKRLCLAPYTNDSGSKCLVQSDLVHPKHRSVDQGQVVEWPNIGYMPEGLKPTDKPLSILEEAQKLIYGDREKDYGPPTQSFQSIADLWTAYLVASKHITEDDDSGSHRFLTPTDVAHLMILLKVSRGLTGGYKQDTYIDIAGYAGCVERIEEDK